jgi:hypothetical protein
MALEPERTERAAAVPCHERAVIIALHVEHELRTARQERRVEEGTDRDSAGAEGRSRWMTATLSVRRCTSSTAMGAAQPTPMMPISAME